MEAGTSFKRLYDIVARLRGPGGCPWDREQTPLSIRANLIEEAYECVEAINEGEGGHIAEELGDLYLILTMFAYMHEEAGAFRVSDCLEGICEKLIRRHPHVFGESEASTPEAVMKQWQEIKVNVEGRAAKDSILDEVSRALPPLERAYKIQKKAAKAGFDWSDAHDVWDKVREETDETEEALAELSAPGSGNDPALRGKAEEELGDLLFSVVNVARFLGIDPAIALQRSTEKFVGRFKVVERGMKEKGLPLSKDNLTAMDELWEAAKAGGDGHGRG